MKTLISLSTSIFDAPWLYERLAYASPGDTILLTQDAVLALQSAISLASFIAKCNAIGVTVCALADDLTIRNIDSQYAKCQLIDYLDYVSLVCENDKQVAW